MSTSPTVLHTEKPKTMRRQVDLPEEDVEYLEALGLPWETIVVQQVNWVLIHDFRIPEGFNHTLVTIAVRVVANYPSAALDMVYVTPPIARRDGTPIPALSEFALEGVVYQQWSRHYTSANPWRVGIDNLGTHVRAAEGWFARAML